MTKTVASILGLSVGLAVVGLVVSTALADQPRLVETSITYSDYTPGNETEVENDYAIPPDDEPIVRSESGGGDAGPHVIPPSIYNGGILGDLERTTQFDIIPGDLTFDLTLWNSESYQEMAHVVLILDYPDGSNMTIYDEMATLEGEQIEIAEFTSYLPDDIENYGRYTMGLLIDDRIADFFQFDLNSRSEIEVRWDDGVMANVGAWYDAGDKWAVRGCMPPGATIDSIGVYLCSEGDPFWPWPDRNHQEISLEMYDVDGAGGLPGTQLFAAISLRSPGTSHAVAYPNITTPNTAFFIVNHQLTAYPQCEGQGMDAHIDHLDQLFEQDEGIWDNYEAIVGGDFMMWAVGHAAGERIIIGNPPRE